MENQTENTNVTSENQQQFEPLHKSFCRECGTMISEKADMPKLRCNTTQSQSNRRYTVSRIESIVVLYPSCRIDFICCSKQRHSYIS